MKKVPLLLLAALSIFYTVQAQWHYVGQPGCSSGMVYYPNIAINSTIPYIAYQEDISGKATVKKYDGSSWSAVGNTGFSADAISYPSLAFANQTPYLTFADAAHGNRVTVMQFNGSNWVAVGQAGFSDSAVAYTSLAIDPNGVIYVAYQNNDMGGTVEVRKYVGGNWVRIGALLPPAFYVSHIALDNNGTPHIAYIDKDNSFLFMKKFNGSGWVSIGPFVLGNPGAGVPAIAIDNSGIPYVAYEEGGSGANVMRYVNSQWTAVGTANFRFGNYFGANYISLAIALDNTPYIAFQDGDPINGSPGKAVAAKFNGTSWTRIGASDLSSGRASYTSIAVDDLGTPYVAFADYTYSYKLTVMSYGTSTGIETVEAEEFQIYPNPATNNLFIQTHGIAVSEINIYNTSGSLISQTKQPQTNSIDISQLAIGIYIAEVKTKEASVMRRWVKM